MPIRIRRHDKSWHGTQVTEAKWIIAALDYRSPGTWINGVLYWHEAKVPHLMRVHLIIVMPPQKEQMKAKIRLSVPTG
jgi:hypothetical protein